jgi:exonuclease I
MSDALPSLMTPQGELVTWLTRLDGLLSIQANGLSRVQHGDRTVQYQSAADVAVAIKVARKEIQRLQVALGLLPAPRTVRQVTFIAGKGL